MKTKRGKSFTVWMLKNTIIDSFLASYPAYVLCSYWDICEYGMVVSDHKADVEQIARQFNEKSELLKVKPVKVRVSLEILSEESTDEE